MASGIVAGVLAAPAAAADYVAMGDSYSSGTGTRDYFDSNCERSNFAYSKLIDPQIPGDWNMVACGGARTQHIHSSGQNGNPPQAQHASVGTGTEYVTLSIGGNDAGFTDVLLECGQPGWLSDCDGAINGAQNTIQNELPGRLNTALDTIRSESSPSTIVTLVGYPRLFNGEDCNALTFFDSGEMTRLNQTADLLADVMRTAARENGYAYADARGAYLGHAVCDSTEWLNGLSNPVGESFHPNKLGHQGYAGIVRAALLAAEQPNVTPGPNGRIAFVRGGDIWVINANGQSPVNLTEGISDPAIDPAWSPDGTKLAFASGPASANDVYVLDFDSGGAPLKLTSDAADDREPTWSPNGDYLAFRSARSGNNDIYRMRANGSEQTRLTASSDSEFAPDWSPDGAEIAYQRCCQNDVWKMNSDGQGQTRLTTDGANDGRPAWSPSGHQIAFHSNRGGGDFEIFTMTPTGGSQTQRTSNAAHDQEPGWSPNGAQIVFRSDRVDGFELYTMTATGGSQTRRTDAAGDEETPSWQGDKTAPETNITSGPGEGATTSLSTPSFGLGSNEPGSSFECRVGPQNPPAGAFGPCSSPHTTAALPDGQHTIQVRAVDPSGNVDPTPAARSFTVDTTPAETAITAGPAAITNDDEPTFEFSSAEQDLQGFECRLDSDDEGDFASCTSPFQAPPLADADHRFDVRSIDAVGNPSEPVSHNFTVDTVAPETELTGGPADPTNVSQPEFEFDSSEAGSSFHCRVDSGEWGSCTSPSTPAAPLSDGPHTFEVRATDPAGNTDGSPAAHSFEVDTVAPDASIDSGPPALDPHADPPPRTPDTTPEFTFSSGDASASFECRVNSLDDADWLACDPPFVTDPLPDGEHTFHVRGVDAAGNAGAAVERTFVVDATKPTVAITSPAEFARVSPDQGPNFVFESDDDFARFECRLYERLPGDQVGAPGAWRDCEPDQLLRDIFEPGDLAEGQRRFEVRAVDSVDNATEFPKRLDFHLDATPPDLEFTQAPANGAAINDSSPSFAFKSFDEHLDRYECRLDEGDWEPCDETAPYEATALADGPHSFAVRAFDLSRNATTRTRDFTVDTTIPAVVIGGGPAGLTNDPTPTYSFSSEPGAALECRVDGAQFKPCSSPHTTASVTDGAHTFEVRATDAAGNADTGQRQFTVDTAPPIVAITAGPAAGERVTESTVSFGFTSSDARSLECRIDDRDGAGAFSACASPYVTPPLANGPNTFHVRAIDQAGNVGDAASRAFTVDVTRPGPRMELKLGKVKRNARRGTARIAVTAGAPGTLVLKARGVKRARKAAKPGSAVMLAIKPGRVLAGKLAAAGTLKLKVKVTFRAQDGSALTKAKRVRLKRA